MLRNKRAIHLAAIAAVTFAAFSPFLSGYFLADDFNLVTLLDRERKAVDWSNTLSDFYTVFRGDPTHSFYRPMLTLSAALDYTVWGPRAFGFHLTNVTLHVANSLLVYGIAMAAPASPGGLVGLAAGLLFAFHPLHPEPVYWVAGRVDLILTFFVLSSFLLFISFCNTRRPAYYLLSLLGFVGALCSKETAVALPVALVLYTAFPLAPASWRRPAEIKAKLTLLAPYLLLLTAYFLFRRAIIGSFVGQYEQPDFEVFRLSALLKGAAHLFGYQLYPIGGELVTSAADALYGQAARRLIVPAGWLLVIGTLGLALGGAWSRRPWLYLGLMLALASPVLTLFAVGGSPLAWARLHYLPSAAYCLFLASFLERRSPLRGILGSLIFAAFLGLLAAYSLPWMVAGRITRDAVRRIEQAAGEGVQRVIVTGNPDFYFGTQLFGGQAWALRVAAALPFSKIPAGVQIIHLPDEGKALEPSSAACQGTGSALLRWNPAKTQLERATGLPRGCPPKPPHPGPLPLRGRGDLRSGPLLALWRS